MWRESFAGSPTKPLTWPNGWHIAVGIYFLVGVEVRIKRNRALRALHVLRSLAHIVDMHQLTKDPERLLVSGPDTPSSPRREMTAFELQRYLDYCSEILSIISKVAALYVQHFRDSVIIGAASDLEALTGGLSRKIWQKIMLLDRTFAVVHAERQGNQVDTQVKATLNAT